MTHNADEIAGYQDTEIDEAKDAVEDRHEHVVGAIRTGILDGTQLDNHENKRMKAYLQGYADALEYAAGRVERIDNMARYVDPCDCDTDEDGDSE